MLMLDGVKLKTLVKAIVFYVFSRQFVTLLPDLATNAFLYNLQNMI